MRPHSGLILLSCLFVGCSKPQPQPEQPQPQPEPPEVDEQPEVDEEANEPIELDVKLEPFETDLDGDGHPESVSWTCKDDELELRVDQATYTTKLGFSEVIGCGVYVVDLDPNQPGMQLWVNADEHDEAGPDRNFFLREAGGEISVIWAENLDFDLYADGSWHTEVTTCDEAQRVYRTTTTVWRWKDGEVVQSAEPRTDPIPADERCYEESEP